MKKKVRENKPTKQNFKVGLVVEEVGKRSFTLTLNKGARGEG
jgi:hypothetical protein